MAGDSNKPEDAKPPAEIDDGKDGSHGSGHSKDDQGTITIRVTFEISGIGPPVQPKGVGPPVQPKGVGPPVQPT